MSDERSSNLLLNEKSPYLLQHAGNPVHWHGWSSEAFLRAEQEDKPVLISIGYATCHWCHVMAHESFEDAEIAEVLNQHFVCIKVDREERPDVDAFYMEVCQAMTGHGGWPLTVFTDAQKRPFFAGTYFPPRARANRIGFLDLIRRIEQAWSSDRGQIMASATEIVTSLQEAASTSFRGEVPEAVFTTVAQHHVRTFDEEHGGFNAQPKFPSPHHLLLLFRMARRSGNSDLVRMAATTLNAMRAGGIYDHVGYGFHRYSTDREWLVPHFEKMLYDQAMMVMAYTEAWQITGVERYRSTVLEIVTYLQREMVGSHGALFSAQDADSEGVEGKFYVWSADELSTILDEDDVSWLKRTYHVRREGNFNDEATGNPTGLNILHGAIDSPVFSTMEETVRWDRIRPVLLEHRSKRIPPLTDDKVLTDWNGLMVVALARAARAFSWDALLDFARSAYRSVVSLCGGAEWVHRYRDGERAIMAMLDDHAAMGWAAVELYQATGNSAYLADAREHADRIIEKFTTADGSLRTVNEEANDLPVQHHSGFDSAYPSGNSMAAMLFTTLGAILDHDGYNSSARACVTSFGLQLERFGPGYCMLLCAWDVLVHGSNQIAFAGSAADTLVVQAASRVAETYLPSTVVVFQPDAADEQGLNQIYPFSSVNTPAVLACAEYSCSRPMYSVDEVLEYLARPEAQ